MREPHVTVVPSGSGATAPPKAAGCGIPVLRSAPVQQPFDELASLHFTTYLFPGDPAVAQASLVDNACALGADAVLVTREFDPGVFGDSGKPPSMAGVAIRFRSVTTPSR
jgi:hypothetical protein